MEEMTDVDIQQASQSCRITQANSPLDGSNLQPEQTPSASISGMPMRNRKSDEGSANVAQPSGSSSSSSSMSDQYLQPVTAVQECERESEGSGYEYADVAEVDQRSSYADLGPRPPHIPSVYDRLRHSRLNDDVQPT